jgi:hypothetical protein
MANRACSLLTFIDYTGIEASDHINFRGRRIYKTKLGGFVSLIAYLSIIAVIVVMFGQLLGPPSFA